LERQCEKDRRATFVVVVAGMVSIAPSWVDVVALADCDVWVAAVALVRAPLRLSLPVRQFVLTQTADNKYYDVLYSV